MRILSKLFIKSLDLSFIIVSKCCCYLLFVILKISRKKKVCNSYKKILALPYYPKNWPGGQERIAGWKKYFEASNIGFDVSWASCDIEFLNYHESKSLIKRYYFYYLVLFRRIALAYKLKGYDKIWIQRNFIPMYPYSDAHFELLLSKVDLNIIMDYYDADYISNFKLTINAVKYANKVTVSTPFLKEYFSTFTSKTHLLNMTIDDSNYKLKKEYNTSSLKLGWMGNPGNMVHLKMIENELKVIEDLFPNVSFHFLCRGNLDLNLNRVTRYSWNDSEFNYFNWLSTIDIGIAPYIGDSDRLKAKSAMKTLEFMACGIPFVTTDHGTFEGMTNGIDYLLANEKKDWINKLTLLIESTEKRKKMGESSHQFFTKKHTYKNNYDLLEKIFFN